MATTDVGAVHGSRVVWTAFVVAVFGWGVGFYGPGIYLVALHRSHGWPSKARRVIGGAPFDAVAGGARLRTTHASGQTMVTVAKATIAPAASSPA